MRYVILSFTFFVLLLTIYEDVSIYIPASGFYLLCSLWFFMLGKISSYKRLFLQLCYILPIVSILLHTEATHDPLPEQTIFSGTIIQGYRSGVYVYEDDMGGMSLLRTDDLLSPGDTIQAIGWTTLAHIPTLFSSTGERYRGGFSYERWLFTKGYTASITAQQVAIVGKGKLSVIDNLRSLLAEHITALYGRSSVAGLLTGLLTGDISLMEEQAYQQFIDAGLVHIVAVSGANIFMLVCALHLLLFFIPYYARCGAIVVFLLIYSLLCGLDVSVLRALVMGSLTLVVYTSGRVISIRRLLAYAYIFLLTIQPYALLYDMGFGLSFLAIIGIIYIHDRCAPLCLKWPRPVSYGVTTYALPTLGATLGVTPRLVWSMGGANLSSLLVNILVLPLLPFLLLGGLLSIGISSTPFFGETLVSFISFGLEWVISLAGRAAPRSLFVYTSPGWSAYLFIWSWILFLCVIGWRVRWLRTIDTK